MPADERESMRPLTDVERSNIAAMIAEKRAEIAGDLARDWPYLAAERDSWRRVAERCEREKHDALAEVAALRQQLDVARAERDEAIAHDRQPYPTADAYEGVCRALKKHRDRADAAEADNARLLDVYRAAEAWRDNIVRSATGSGVVTLDDVNVEAHMERKLITAVDAYRAGAPAEAPDGERA